MIARVVAWSLVALFCGVLFRYGGQLRSPWAVVSSPVLSQLPAAGHGCTDDCK